MINNIIEISATAIDTLLLLWFIPHFVGVSVRKKYFALALPLLQLTVQLIFDRYLPGYSLLPMIIMFVLVLAFAVVLSPSTVLWDLLAASVYISVIMFISSFVFTVFSLFSEDMASLIQGSQTNVRFIFLSVAKLVQFSAYELILLLFKKDKGIDPLSGGLSFAFTVVTVIGLSNLMKIAADPGTGEGDVSVFTLALILVLVNVMLYLFVRQIQKLGKSKYELMLMGERIGLEEKHSEEANIIWENIRKVQHDLKNHFVVMEAQLDKGDIRACKDYLQSIQQTTVDHMGTLIRSGNSVVDYLINSKLWGRKDVQIIISGYVGDFRDITPADMVSILGNVLDNGLEALEKVTGEKRLGLYFSKIKRNRMIICKNTINGSVLDQNRELLTTKENPESHGIGHQIVESTVEKYGGFVDYFEENGMFGVQISIPEPDDKES